MEFEPDFFEICESEEEPKPWEVEGVLATFNYEGAGTLQGQ
jgi:hypothetical protein